MPINFTCKRKKKINPKDSVLLLRLCSGPCITNKHVYFVYALYMDKNKALWNRRSYSFSCQLYRSVRSPDYATELSMYWLLYYQQKFSFCRLSCTVPKKLVFPLSMLLKYMPICSKLENSTSHSPRTEVNYPSAWCKCVTHIKCRNSFWLLMRHQ